MTSIQNPLSNNNNSSNTNYNNNNNNNNNSTNQQDSTGGNNYSYQPTSSVTPPIPHQNCRSSNGTNVLEQSSYSNQINNNNTNIIHNLPQSVQVVTFVFSSGNRIAREMLVLNEISPFFPVKITAQSSAPLTINLPEYITPQALTDLICLVENNSMMIDDSSTKGYLDLLNVLKTSEFFQNDEFSLKIINDLIMQVLAPENVIEFFKYCYSRIINYINNDNSNGNNLNRVWFKFFFKCLDIMEENFFINDSLMENILQLDKKIVEEVICKILYKYVIVDECKNLVFDNFNKVVDLILIIRYQKSFFTAIVNETFLVKNLFIPENKNIKENLTRNFEGESLDEDRPTTCITLGKYEIKNLYREICIEIVSNFFFDLILLVSYDYANDLMTFGLKFKKKNNKEKVQNFLEIFPFSCELIIISNNNTGKNTVYEKNALINLTNKQLAKNYFRKICSFENFRNKFKLDLSSSNPKLVKNFSFEMNLPHKAKLNQEGKFESINKSDYNVQYVTPNNFLIKCYLKMNLILASLLTRTITNYDNIYDDKAIKEIDEKTLADILLNEKLNKKCEDEIIISLLNWRKFIL